MANKVLTCCSRLLNTIKCASHQNPSTRVSNVGFVNLRIYQTVATRSYYFQKFNSKLYLEGTKNIYPAAVCHYSQDTGEKKKKTLYQRIKEMYKDYWYVLVPVHVATSAVWYGGFYYLIVSGVDIGSLLEVFGAPESWVEKARSSKAGAFVGAYTLYKLATPARYTVTLGGTTISINYLTKWGWIKPIPNKEQLKIMYEERKGAFKELKTCYQDKMQVTKDEIKDEFMKTKEGVKQHYIEAKEGLQRTVVDTRQELKQGVEEATSEWKHVGGLVKKATVEMLHESIKTNKLGEKKPK